MQEKLKDTVKPKEIGEATVWLARGDVRLISAVEREGITGYELAHERMIPALMQLSGKELIEADRANKLLDTRVNEWLGSNGQSRYLFDPWELWLIEQQKPYLIWGTKREQKQRLLRQSKRQIYRVTSVIAITIAMIMFFSGWLLYTPEGQMQRVRWAITNPLDSPVARVSDAAATRAAVALAKDGRWQFAFKLVANHVNHYQYKAYFLSQFATVVPQQKGASQARAKLKRTLAEAEQIDNLHFKSSALRAIAAAYRELKDEKAAKEVWLALVKAAEQIDNPDFKSSALIVIAVASGELTNIEVTQAVLHDTLLAAEAANASSALVAIAIQYAQQYDWGKALQALRKCPESVKVIALAQVLTLWAEKKNPQLIDGAVVLNLEVKGTPNNYIFDVSLHSPDLGCDQYTDWWEVLSEDGELLYRQVFEKSHVHEQPFDSSGGPVKIQENEVIIVRAHMHSKNYNYNGKHYGAMQAWKGTVKNGFKMIRLSKNFAASVAKVEPQPPECQSN